MADSTFSFCQFKSRKKTIRGSLHLPQNKGGTWVILSHGFTGSRMGPGYLFVKVSRALAACGVSSLRFDFSGSGESDGLFSDTTCDTMVADLLKAVSYVRRRFKPAHLVLLGHSLGGAVSALCLQKALPDALILLAPVADPTGLAQRREELIVRGTNTNGFFENGPHEMGPAFLESLQHIAPVDAVARNLAGALLLIQGDADPSIPVRESAQYVQAARKAGILVRYHVHKGSDHNFSTVLGHSFVCSTICDWIKELKR